MCTEQQTLFRLGLEFFLDHDCPETTGGSHLGNLHVKVHADGPEERQTRSELVDCHSRFQSCADILQSVSNREGHLQDVIGSRLLHMVSGNGDRVVFGHVVCGVRENITNNLHRGLRRVDEGVTDHKLLQDIVLNSTGKLCKFCSLLS